MKYFPANIPFLATEWRHLLMLNFAIEPEVLRPYVPAGTELDFWHGQCLVSIVGLQFHHTRVCGVAVPGHRFFDEVNLRFYVRRQVGGEWRRGVVFLREIVSRPAITWVARLTYNEAYATHPMRSNIRLANAYSGGQGSVLYEWQTGREWSYVRAQLSGLPQRMEPASQAEFILERYWGYVQGPRGSALEYRVVHPRWRVWRAEEAEFSCPVSAVYGAEFAPALEAVPATAFLATGSPVHVFRGNPCEATAP